MDNKEIIPRVSSNLLGQHHDFLGKNNPVAYPSTDNIIEIIKK